MPRVPAYFFLLRARDRIERDYATKLTVDVLADEAMMSAGHFSRQFVKAFGETPHQYLLRRRIERAKDLLRGTDRSVTEICLDVGFNSLGSFSTAFDSFVGSAPSTYRRSHTTTAPPSIPGCYSMMWTRPVERQHI